MKSSALLSLIGASLALAQIEVTIYAPKVSDGLGLGLGAEFDETLGHVMEGAELVGASAIAVDSEGRTIYRALEAQSVMPTTVNGVLTTTIIPTPTTQTFTFRADASRIYQELSLTTTTAGVEVKVDMEVDCTYQFENDTPEAMICKGQIDLVGKKGGDQVKTQLLGTITAEAEPYATIVTPANPGQLPESNSGSRVMGGMGALVGILGGLWTMI